MNQNSVSLEKDFVDQAQCYRDLAGEILARIPSLTHLAIVDELLTLAANYERLAEFVEQGGSTWHSNIEVG